MKTINSSLIIFICCFILCFSCEKKDVNEKLPEPAPVIYKFRDGKNYFNNVYVALNDEKTRIIAYPSYGDLKYDSIGIIDIYKGYYFVPMGCFNYGINTAYLDMTVEEFEHADDIKSAPLD